MTEQKKRGRKPANNAAVLAEILKNAETRKKFEQQIDVLVENKKTMLLDSEAFSEDVAAVAERTQLSKGFINKIVAAIANGKEDVLMAESEGIAEVLKEVFNVSGE